MIADHAFFAEHGWLVVRNAVAAERVAELARVVDEIFGAWPAAHWRPGEVWELANVSRGAPAIAAHVRDAAIAERVAAALGCARVQLLQDTVLVKPPRSAATVAWHQDHTYTGYVERVATVRLALTADTVESGCLEVMDRSHLAGAIGEVRALTESRVVDALAGSVGAADAADGQRIIAVELAPGDISIHHCLTLHRSGDNRSDAARKTLVTRIFDASCTLRPERLPAGAAAHFPTTATGHLAESAFPRLWPPAI